MGLDLFARERVRGPNDGSLPAESKVRTPCGGRSRPTLSFCSNDVSGGGQQRSSYPFPYLNLAVRKLSENFFSENFSSTNAKFGAGNSRFLENLRTKFNFLAPVISFVGHLHLSVGIPLEIICCVRRKVANTCPPTFLKLTTTPLSF